MVLGFRFDFAPSVVAQEWEQQWLRWKMAIDVGEEMWSAAFQLIEARWNERWVTIHGSSDTKKEGLIWFEMD